MNDFEIWFQIWNVFYITETNIPSILRGFNLKKSGRIKRSLYCMGWELQSGILVYM